MMVDRQQFRRALGRFVTGVTIVTARDEGAKPVGLTVNSFNSVSLDPPIVLWSLARKSLNLPVFEAARHFAINVLARDQRQLSERFSQPLADRFEGVDWASGAGGVPVLAGTTAVFECESENRVEAGDHVIFLGRVISFRHADKEPLIFHAGRYVMPADPS